MSKPTFGWKPNSADMRQRLACALRAQKFFSMICAEGLSGPAVRTKYRLDIEAIKASMSEMGIEIQSPAWFTAVLQ